MLRRAHSLAALLALLLLSCAPSRPAQTVESAVAAAPTPPKRIVVGVQTDFPALATRMVRSGAGSRPGVPELEQLVNAGLTQTDANGALQGELAEAVPTTANGLWRVFPDGRMET